MTSEREPGLLSKNMLTWVTGIFGAPFFYLVGNSIYAFRMLLILDSGSGSCL